MTADPQTVLATLLPAGAHAHSTTCHVADGPLSPAERDYISQAVAERRGDFVTGRHCAVSALAALGKVVPYLGRRPDRQPDWPRGTVGSITHCEGLCAAAVAEAATTRFLGIDAEPHAALPDGVLARVASPSERAELARLADATGQKFTDRTLFSAKEAVFKALFPAVGTYFGFEEVELRVDAARGRFRARLSDPLARAVGLAEIDGRYATTDRHTLTAVHVAA